MKIGIFGGSFNPIHLGHIEMVKVAKQEFALDRIIIVPTGDSYHKDTTTFVSGAHRIAMIKLAIQTMTNTIVSDVDIIRNKPTYTIDTLKDLILRYGDNDYYFILGEDSLDYLEKWKDASYLFKHMQFIVLRREGEFDPIESTIDHLTKQYSARIHVGHMPKIAISSSNIREKVKVGTKVSELIPEGVETYIATHKLYMA